MQMLLTLLLASSNLQAIAETPAAPALEAADPINAIRSEVEMAVTLDYAAKLLKIRWPLPDNQKPPELSLVQIRSQAEAEASTSAAKLVKEPDYEAIRKAAELNSRPLKSGINSIQSTYVASPLKVKSAKPAQVC
jgi:hypothetical protein